MTAPRTVLISGASVSGPALAYWLRRAGFAVTVVEKAGALRGGGYPVDIRGTATEVVRRMGLWPRLREAHVGPRRATFLDAAGRTVASLRAPADEGEPRDLEIRRGDLADALYGLVRDDVEFRFGDSVARFDPAAHGVDVTFRSGRQGTYDLVIGADGMHSATRAALFGPEDRHHRYLGYCFALFTLPNPARLDRELVLWNTPGKAAALYATGAGPEVHGFLTFHRPEPPRDALRDADAQRALVAEVFAGEGWEILAWWRPRAAPVTCSSTRPDRSACPAGRTAAPPSSATPRTPRPSSPGRAPASRCPAPTSSPTPWPPTGTTRRPSPRTRTVCART